jgi:hypothetical protein
MQLAVDTESFYCIFMFWNEVFAHSTMCAQEQARNNVTNFNIVKPDSCLHEVLHRVDWNLEGGHVSMFMAKRQMMWIMDRFTLKTEMLRSNNLSVTLANDQLNAHIFFYTFITILYRFRAISYSSSGGHIVLIQPLVSSLWKLVSCLKLL